MNLKRMTKTELIEYIEEYDLETVEVITELVATLQNAKQRYDLGVMPALEEYNKALSELLEVQL